jgi:ABC-type microcin C transport system permease subunit YejE
MWSHEVRGLEGIMRALPSVVIGVALGALSGVLGIVARVVSEWLQDQES